MATLATNTQAQTSAAPLSASQVPPTCRVLIPFATPFLYGMERAVIETFDSLRPEIEACFVEGSRIVAADLPVFHELRRRHFELSLFPDKTDWPRIGRPESLRHFVRMAHAFVRGNLAVLGVARGKHVLYVPGLNHASFAALAAMLYRVTG